MNRLGKLLLGILTGVAIVAIIRKVLEHIEADEERPSITVSNPKSVVQINRVSDHKQVKWKKLHDNGTKFKPYHPQGAKVTTFDVKVIYGAKPGNWTNATTVTIVYGAVPQSLTFTICNSEPIISSTFALLQGTVRLESPNESSPIKELYVDRHLDEKQEPVRSFSGDETAVIEVIPRPGPKQL